jgi:2-aminoethylphosphonate-pyruvate transaminase
MAALLLNPGPVTLSPRVRAALAGPDMCHREPEFAALTRDVLGRLGRVYAAAASSYAPILITGSGTCAVEAMIATFVPREGRALVVANGVYGERMADMVRAQGKGLQLLRGEWTAPLDLEGVAAALAQDATISHVLTVHNETTTGRRNDLAALGGLCRARGVPVLLDAVSSFGGEDVELGSWNVAALASTANKCLHGVPGISFVMASRELLAAAAGSPGQAPSVYLDLCRYAAEQENGYSPFTLAVHACLALQEALAELEEEGGWPARRARYRKLAGAIRSGLGEMGIRTFIPEQDLSSMISSFCLPEGMTYEELHAALKAAGFVIYAGQGGLRAAMFRIANMGHIEDADVERLLATFRSLTASRGGA